MYVVSLCNKDLCSILQVHWLNVKIDFIQDEAKFGYCENRIKHNKNRTDHCVIRFDKSELRFSLGENKIDYRKIRMCHFEIKIAYHIYKIVLFKIVMIMTEIC